MGRENLWRSGRSLVALVLLVSSVVSCSKGKHDAPMGATRSETTTGENVSSKHRIVSLAPAVTETLSALGFESALVGRSRFCDHPPSVLSLPAVGGFFDPNVEAIVALKPDLLFATKGPLERSLAGLPPSIHSTFFEIESASTIEEMARTLSKDLGAPERGIAFAEKLEQDLKSLEKLGPLIKDRPLRVLLLVGVDPIVAASDKSFPGELLRVAGGTNAIRPEGTLQVTYPVLSLETLATLDPDLLLRLSGEGSHRETEFLERYPTSKALRVVREKKVVEVRDDRMLRPGPRMVDAARALRGLLEAKVAQTVAEEPKHESSARKP